MKRAGLGAKQMRMLLSVMLLSAVGMPLGAAAQERLYPRILGGVPATADAAGEDPRRVVRPGLFAHLPPIREAMSADGAWFLSTDTGGRLRVRAAGGESEVIAAPLEGWRWDVEGARWSPDGEWIAARVIDDRAVARFTIGDGKGGSREIAYSHAGTPIPAKRLFVLRRDGSDRIEIPLLLDYVNPLRWTSGSDALFYIESDRVNRHVELRRFDVASRSSVVLLEERSNAHAITGLDLGDGYAGPFERSNRVLFPGDDQFLWLTEKDGAPHLMLHRDGEPPRSLTESLDGIVYGVAGLNPANDAVAVLEIATDAPWAEHRLYRLSLAGGAPKLLHAAPNIDSVEIVDDGLTIVESDLPATVRVHRIDWEGRASGTVEEAKLDFLLAEPVTIERHALRGADGTLLQALLVLPEGDGRVPLVDHIYGGPQTTQVPAGPVDPDYADAIMLAREGLATIFIDARGTPRRGTEFVHAQDGRLGATVIADHASALRELLASHPRLDADRVGIMGHSWGGYFALRGMIETPGLFKAAAMLAANTDASTMRVPIEAYQGCLPAACPDAYRQGDLSHRLDEVRGPILLVHGGSDDDVLPEVAETLAARLEAQSIEHEFVRLPDANHIVQRDPGHIARLFAFFKEAL